MQNTTAATQIDHTILSATAAAFVRQQTAALPGKIDFSVDQIDNRIALRPCRNIEAFLPAGSKLIGRVAIGVRCAEPGGWSIFVPVQIKITLDLLVSARAMTTGQIIHAEDLTRQKTEMTQNTGMTDANLAIGKVLTYSISAGYVLRENMLRAPYSVKQGQSVKLYATGGGFSLSNTGVALNNASEGESVQIRTASGRVVSGNAGTDGIVLIKP